MRTEVCSVKNARDYMEDRYSVNSRVCRGAYFFAVYDGHGGNTISDACADDMPDTVCKLMDISGDDAKYALVEALKRIDRKCLDAVVSNEGHACGTTVCMGLLDRKAKKLTVANVGDSRMVVRTASGMRQITDDHCMEHAGDRARIARQGGRVIRDTFGGERVMGVLNMTRALGDWYLRPFVSPEPDVYTYTLGRKDKYICTASDGLWDVMTMDDVMGIVDKALSASETGRQTIDPRSTSARSRNASTTPKRQRNIARTLVDEAIRRGSTDNITVVLTHITDPM
jgi:protein phosphatase 2C